MVITADMALQIDVVYTEDCTDWQTADQILRQVVADLGLQAEFNYWTVENDRQAIEWNFIGSPTIYVNGKDLFPTTGVTAGLKLRSYITEEGLLGHPTYNMLYEALSPYAR